MSPVALAQVRRRHAPNAHPYRDVVMADGPLGYWPLDELTGTVTKDHSGNGFNGTYQAGTLNDGVFANGTPCIRSVSATKSPVLLTGAGFTLPPAGFSMEAWVNLTAASVEWEVLLVNGQILFANPSKPALQTYVSSGTSIISPTAITLNRWTHIVGTANASARRLYVNGVQVVTSTGGAYTKTDSATAASIGGNPTTSGFSCVGLVAQAAVYGSVLSAQQILNHYNSRNS